MPNAFISVCQILSSRVAPIGSPLSGRISSVRAHFLFLGEIGHVMFVAVYVGNLCWLLTWFVGSELRLLGYISSWLGVFFL